MTSLSGVTPLGSYSAFSSATDLKVPSSRTAWLQGTLAAPGIWPPRWAVSDSPGGASISPENAAGDRARLGGPGAARRVGLLRLVGCPGRRGEGPRRRALLLQPLLAAAVHQL